MATKQLGLSILDRFNFERKPVGVKFMFTKPDGIERLDKILDFCEMLVEAQEGSSFYADKENFTCIGPFILGMIEHNPIFEAGEVGPKLEVFKEARANRRIYQFIPRLGQDTVNYVAFSPSDQLTFEPDVLVITANTSQAEILLRAMSYTSGEIWSSKGTPVAACSWLYVYPFTSGELNFTVTGFGFGMKSRRLFPDGLILISIPWDLLPSMVENLQDMNWVPHSHTIGGEEHKKKVGRIVEELQKELTTE